MLDVPRSAWVPLLIGVLCIAGSQYLLESGLPAWKGYPALGAMALGWCLAAVGAYRVYRSLRG